MRKRLPLIAAVLVSLTAASLAWHAGGHGRVALIADESLKGKLPAFFVDGAPFIVGCSGDPDTWCKPIGAPMLSDASRPEHYYDSEFMPEFADGKLPPDRYVFLKAVYAKDLTPKDVGLLPYAVTEGVYKLAVAFAEYRKWPDDPAIRAKCLVRAGELAHYAGDLCMPLHTTVHYNGRVEKPGAKAKKKGIHLKVDALLGKLKDRPGFKPADIKPTAYKDVFAAVQKELARSYSLVDATYALEDEFPGNNDPIEPGSKVEAYAQARLKEAAQFTANLFLTAWEDSAKIKLPKWHVRP